MSIHIAAENGEIAEKVLLPGDPLRAKFIAENLLEGSKCYNEVRGMLGYTGMYKGKKVSVQGTGMGIPSIMIYVHELINFYGAKKLIRIGTCGSISEKVNVREVILAMGASTDSAVNKIIFDGADFCPTASYWLLNKAVSAAKNENVVFHVGNVITSDMFYQEDKLYWEKWRKYGIMAAEMETAGLYSISSKFGIEALSILTVSDNILSEESTSALERQNSFMEMSKIALEIV